MTTTFSVGRSAGGKPINPSQLQAELVQAGVQANGVGTYADQVFTYDAQGQAADFAAADQATVDQVITNHVAMRDKTDAEYSEEFQNPATTAARKQEIRDMQSGLMPREQVPM